MPSEAVLDETPARASTPRIHVECDMPGVRWCYVPARDWPAEAEGLAILSENERRVFEGLRHPSRRQQWLAGRFVAKHLLLDDRLDTERVAGSDRREGSENGGRARRAFPPVRPGHQIDIDTRHVRGRASPPLVRVAGEVIPVRLSLAHCTRGLIVACSTLREIAVGVDLVDLNEVRPNALATWFTSAERAQLDLSSFDDVAERWAVKEALYKAACRDESFAPQQVEALRTDDGWRCRFFGLDLGPDCRLSVRRLDEQLAAIVTLVAAQSRNYREPGRIA